MVQLTSLRDYYGPFLAIDNTVLTMYLEFSKCFNSTNFVLVVMSSYCYPGLPGGISGKEPACQCRRRKRHGFDPWVEKIHWKSKWQLNPVFFPGKSHGQSILADRDTTEAT